MKQEKYIKLNGKIYYESELRLMSDQQLNDLVIECQYGIDEITAKKLDYENVNSANKDDDHFIDVINKFETASVYLQSDIILINKIIKQRKLMNREINELDWYKKYYDITSRVMTKRKWIKTCKLVTEESGVALENLVWRK